MFAFVIQFTKRRGHLVEGRPFKTTPLAELNGSKPLLTDWGDHTTYTEYQRMLIARKRQQAAFVETETAKRQ